MNNLASQSNSLFSVIITCVTLFFQIFLTRSLNVIMRNCFPVINKVLLQRQWWGKLKKKNCELEYIVWLYWYIGHKLQNNYHSSIVSVIMVYPSGLQDNGIMSSHFHCVVHEMTLTLFDDQFSIGLIQLSLLRNRCLHYSCVSYATNHQVLL